MLTTDEGDVPVRPVETGAVEGKVLTLPCLCQRTLPGLAGSFACRASCHTPLPIMRAHPRSDEEGMISAQSAPPKKPQRTLARSHSTPPKLVPTTATATLELCFSQTTHVLLFYLFFLVNLD